MEVSCPECGMPCRVMQVDENAPQGVLITYTCPSRRCIAYGLAATTRTLAREPPKDSAAKQPTKTSALPIE